MIGVINMAAQKKHYVILNKTDGSIEKHPMKQWLRQHSECLPKDMNADINTSHELRRGLKREGWLLEEKDEEVLLYKPNLDDTLDKTEEATEEMAREITFGLERDLQSALRLNIGKLEAGLKIIDNGKERITEAGRVDITAEDDDGNIVVIELKAGTATPDVISQILAYMGAIRETDDKPIRGILIAGDFHKQVIFAAKAVPSLKLVKYSFKFTFEPMV